LDLLEGQQNTAPDNEEENEGAGGGERHGGHLHTRQS